MQKEVCVLAHACGVSTLRQLNRNHGSIMQENGKSAGMMKLHPAAKI
jgi:hypothetical protein